MLLGRGKTVGKRKFQNKGLQIYIHHISIINATKVRQMKCARHVERTEAIRNAHIILVIKPELKRPLAGHKLRQGDNINIDIMIIILWKQYCRLS